MKPYQPTLTTRVVNRFRTQPNVLLWTLWRSGTHWLADMLSELMGIPASFVSNGPTHREETFTLLDNWQRNTIMIRHVCMAPDELLPRIESLNAKVVFLYRDLRDVVASHVNMRKYREGYRDGMPPFPDMSSSEILRWELDHMKDHYTRLLPAWVETDQGSFRLGECAQ